MSCLQPSAAYPPFLFLPSSSSSSSSPHFLSPHPPLSPFPSRRSPQSAPLKNIPLPFSTTKPPFFSCDARTKPPPPLRFSCLLLLLLLLLRPQSASMKKRPGRLPPMPRTHTPTDARVHTHTVRRRRRPRLRPPRPPPPSAAARAVVIGQLFRGRRVEGGRGPLSPAPLQVQGGEGRRVWRWRKVIRTPPRERERD